MAGNERFVYIAPSDIERVKSLSDGIFAFSMTLLIITSILPDLPKTLSETALQKVLIDYWPKYLIYIISFLNISNYWMAHYTIFDHIIRSNRLLLRLNLLLLLSVTFLPFPSVLMSQYGRHATVSALYGITTTWSYLMLILIASYAYAGNRLTRPQLRLPLKRLLIVRMLLPLSCSAIGTVFAYFFPRLSFLLYGVIALTNLLPLQLFMKDVDIIYPTHPSKSF